MTDRSRKSLAGLILIFFIVIGDLIVGFADSPSKPNTFTRAVADALYCAIGSPNCLNNYCNNFNIAVNNLVDNCGGLDASGGMYCPNANNAGILGSPQCTSQTNIGEALLYLQKTTKTAFTSATFTNIVSGNGWVLPTNAVYSASVNQFIACTATFDFDTGVGTTIALFRIRDITNSVNSGYTMQLGPGLVLNSNETLAFMAGFTHTAQATPTFALQVSVSGAAGTITIGPGAMLCTRTQGDTNIGVVA